MNTQPGIWRRASRLLAALALALPAAAAPARAQDEARAGGDGVTRVLAVGNSFSDDAVTQYLCELAREAGVTMVIGNAYRGGQGLESHWREVSEGRATFEYRKVSGCRLANRPGSALADIIADEPWDYITFQQVSQESGLAATIEPYLTRLEEYTRGLQTNPRAQYGYHMTWAYARDATHSGFAHYGSSQRAMYDSIVSVARGVMAAHPELDFLVPSGTAIQNARTTYLGDNMNRDGYHLDYKIGRYTAACAWLETITGKSPVGLTFRPDGVDALTARTCQVAAHAATRRPYEVTPLPDEGYPAVNTLRPTALVKLNFGASPTADKTWNNITPDLRTHTLVTDAKGNPTGITVTRSDEFNGVNSSGSPYTTTKMLMPAEVSSSCVWGYASGSYGGNSQPTGGYTLGHLNPELKYDITLFASRAGCKDFRETAFLVRGGDTRAGSLEAAGNATETLLVKNNRPAPDGTITITAMPGPRNTNVNKFYYLNALTVKAH